MQYILKIVEVEQLLSVKKLWKGFMESFSMTSSKDLTGKKFGLLTVTKNIDAGHSGKYAIRNIVVKYFGFKEINTIASFDFHEEY